MISLDTNTGAINVPDETGIEALVDIVVSRNQTRRSGLFPSIWSMDFKLRLESRIREASISFKIVDHCSILFLTQTPTF